MSYTPCRVASNSYDTTSFTQTEMLTLPDSRKGTPCSVATRAVRAMACGHNPCLQSLALPSRAALAASYNSTSCYRIRPPQGQPLHAALDERCRGLCGDGLLGRIVDDWMALQIFLSADASLPHTANTYTWQLVMPASYAQDCPCTRLIIRQTVDIQK